MVKMDDQEPVHTANQKTNEGTQHANDEQGGNSTERSAPPPDSTDNSSPLKFIKNLNKVIDFEGCHVKFYVEFETTVPLHNLQAVWSMHRTKIFHQKINQVTSRGVRLEASAIMDHSMTGQVCCHIRVINDDKETLGKYRVYSSCKALKRQEFVVPSFESKGRAGRAHSAINIRRLNESNQSNDRPKSPPALPRSQSAGYKATSWSPTEFLAFCARSRPLQPQWPTARDRWMRMNASSGSKEARRSRSNGCQVGRLDDGAGLSNEPTRIQRNAPSEGGRPRCGPDNGSRMSSSGESMRRHFLKCRPRQQRCESLPQQEDQQRPQLKQELLRPQREIEDRELTPRSDKPHKLRSAENPSSSTTGSSNISTNKNSSGNSSYNNSSASSNNYSSYNSSNITSWNERSYKSSSNSSSNSMSKNSGNNNRSSKNTSNNSCSNNNSSIQSSTNNNCSKNYCNNNNYSTDSSSSNHNNYRNSKWTRNRFGSVTRLFESAEDLVDSVKRRGYVWYCDVLYRWYRFLEEYNHVSAGIRRMNQENR